MKKIVLSANHKNLVKIFLAIIALLILVFFVANFIEDSDAEKAFEKYFHRLNISSLKAEDSIQELHAKYALLKRQGLETGELKVPLYELDSLTQAIDQKFESQCASGDIKNCSLEILTSYFLNVMSRSPSFEDGKSLLLKNKTFVGAMESWKIYFDKEPLSEKNIYDFLLFIALLDKFGTLEKNYKEKYLDEIAQLKISAVGPTDKVYSLWGKLYCLGRLHSITEENKIGDIEYVRQNELLMKNCPLMPSEQDLLAADDPCVAYTYLRLKSLCEQKPLSQIFSESKAFRDEFLKRRYDSAKKLFCQLTLHGK